MIVSRVSRAVAEESVPVQQHRGHRCSPPLQRGMQLARKLTRTSLAVVTQIETPQPLVPSPYCNNYLNA